MANAPGISMKAPPSELLIIQPGLPPGIRDLFLDDDPVDAIDEELNLRAMEEAACPRSDDDVEVELVLHPLYPQLVEAVVACLKVGEPAARVQQLERKEGLAHEHLQAFAARAAAEGYCSTRDPGMDSTLEHCIRRLQHFHGQLSSMLQASDLACQAFERHLNTPIRAAGGQPASSDSSKAMQEDGQPAASQAKSSAVRKRVLDLADEIRSRCKKGKLPPSSVGVLKAWWGQHQTWPYPTEADKAELEQATGLDHTQVSNWFINQRKRHWHKKFPNGPPQSKEEAERVLGSRGKLRAARGCSDSDG